MLSNSVWHTCSDGSSALSTQSMNRVEILERGGSKAACETVLHGLVDTNSTKLSIPFYLLE